MANMQNSVQQKLCEKRVGEKSRLLTTGERMIIDRYGGFYDLDILFEDGTKAYHKNYNAFKNGTVRKPKMVENDDIRMLIGSWSKDDKGNDIQLIEYYSNSNITVRYKNGFIVQSCTLKQFNEQTIAVEREESLEHYILMNGRKDKAITIEQERRRTFQNALELIGKYRRCVMVRPCGFGKTTISLKFFRRYKKSLFLYPQADELHLKRIEDQKEFDKKSNAKHKMGKVDCKTYAWLRNLSDEQIRNLDYDFVFLDEVHCVGGDINSNEGAVKTYTAVQKLMMWHPKMHFLGATATPCRMDGIDVIQKLFYGMTCYPYTENDAMLDGIIKAPYYKCCVNNTKIIKRDLVKKKEEKFYRKFTKDELAEYMPPAALDEIDAEYMPKHIKKYCDTYLDNTDYMRFIAYYLHIDDIKDGKEKVVQWFKKAYPNHEIHTTEVHSRSKEDLSTVDNLPVTPGRIDIIFNCEKLCMGYHSEHITGLILDRKTNSFTKYKQMIGRLLSCDNDKPVIIFDIPDNYHTDFVFKRNFSFKDTEEIKIEEVLPDDLYVTKNFQYLWHKYADKTDWSKIAHMKEEDIPLQEPAPVVVAMEEAEKAIDDQGLTFEESVVLCEDLQSDYIHNENTYHEKRNMEINNSTINITKAYIADRINQTNINRSNINENSDLGYNPGTYKKVDDNLIQVIQNTINVDGKNVIKKISGNLDEVMVKEAIAKYQTYDALCVPYTSLEEVDKKDFRFSMLKACCEIILRYDDAVYDVIDYMVKHAKDNQREQEEEEILEADDCRDL